MSNDLATMFSGAMTPIAGLDEDTLAVAGGARQGLCCACPRRCAARRGARRAGCGCGGLPDFGGCRKYVVDSVAAGGACADVPLLAGDAPPRMGCDYDGL